MTLSELPSKLAKEPLVDVVFEMRFTASMPASVVLPGMLITQLGIEGGDQSIERLPLHDLPAEVRKHNQGMRYQPVLRVHWGGYVLIIGDNSVGVASKIPYRGWTEFREKIIEVVGIVMQSRVASVVDRIALKYVDLIPGDTVKEQLERINLNIVVGDHRLERESFNVRVEVPKASARHIINIGAPATVRNDKGERKGAIVDIDSLCPVKFEGWESFYRELPDMLNAVHAENKSTFFSCLTSETIEFLEPSYE